MKKTFKTVYLVLEFILLFFGIPVLLYYTEFLVHPAIILPVLLLIVALYFRHRKDFSFRELIRLDISKRMIRINIAVIIIVAILLFGMVLAFERESLFNLPKGNPKIWLLLCIGYPVYSAYIQEVIYRTFLFLRYKPVFKKGIFLILASGIAFSFVHIIYYSLVSLILTLIAGLYLAYIYHKTRSVLFTSILHGILGDIIFTVGLGHHFWMDMYQWL